MKISDDFKSFVAKSLWVGFVAIFSCGEPEQEIELAPSIESLTPKRGRPGDQVIIRGKQLTKLVDIKVFFENEEAVINSVSDSIIEARVPLGGKDGSVLIKSGTLLLSAGNFIYKKDPSLDLSPARMVTDQSAKLQANLTLGSGALQQSGFVYSTSPINSIDDGTKVFGQFLDASRLVDGNLTGLTINTLYYFRAFAITEDGLGLSNQLTFKTANYHEWFKVSEIEASEIRIESTFTPSVGSVVADRAYIMLNHWDGNDVISSFLEFQSGGKYGLYSRFPGRHRDRSITMFVDNNVFFGLGERWPEYFKDFWRFNIKDETWTQVASFPIEVYLPQSFTIAKTCYVIASSGGSIYTTAKLFYKYLPTTDSWVKLEGLKIPISFLASAFSIGNYGYVLLDGSYTMHLMKYDHGADQWSLEKDFFVEQLNNGVVRKLVTLIANERAFVIFPGQGTAEYNPISNSWVVRNTFPPTTAGGFVLDNTLYVVSSNGLYCYKPKI